MKFGQVGAGPPKGAIDTTHERRRMILMGVALVFVVIVFAVMQMQKGEDERAREGELEGRAQAPIEVEIITPEIDLPALLEVVRDATETERVTVEREAVAIALECATKLVDGHFMPMGGRVLDAATAAEILADPGAHRAQLLRARGRIEELRREDGPAGGQIARGRLELEDGTQSWFVLRHLSEVFEPGSFVRMDGIFVQAFRDQLESGWADGPFIVGPRAVRSYPEITAVEELTPEIFALVEDADLDRGGELPFTELFELMAFARDRAAEAIDWSETPVLNNDLFASIFKDGSAHRAHAIRIPISKVMDAWDSAAQENPARLDTVCEGWIGNFEWIAKPGVLRFQAPFVNPGLERGDLAHARGFFLLNHKYTPRDGGIAVAPYFVLHSIEEFVPEESNLVRNIFIVVTITLLLMAAVFWIVLMRDKRKAQALQEELVRRRRARRARHDQQAPAQP